MRRVTDSEDRAALELLNKGVQAASDTSAIEKRLGQLEEQSKMHNYALMNIFKTLTDYPLVKKQIDELDYRTLGMLGASVEINGESYSELVNKKALDARKEAFDELAASDDKNKGLVDAGDDAVIAEDSNVIFTTDCASYPEAGVFRSKIDLANPELKDQKEFFLGKKKGDTFPMKIQGKDHVATILSVRKKADATPEQ